MDTAETTHISLCAGYGGIDLGLRRVLQNLRTIAYSEVETFAVENLLARMEGGQLDPAPVWSDLRTFPWSQFSGLVDILSGGFPCQPFSSAGKRAGDEDARHLFPHILEGIRQCRPSIVCLENVEGIISSKLAGDHWNDPAGTPVLLHVLRELERVGYKATAGVFSASECGASHQRKRVFILAMADPIPEGLQRCLREQSDTGGLQQQAGRSGDCVWPSRPGEPQYEWEPPRVVANSISIDNRCETRINQAQEQEAGRPTGGTGRSSESMGNTCGDGGIHQQKREAEERVAAARTGKGMGNASDTGQPKRGSGTVGQPQQKQELERPDCNGNNSECETQSTLGGDTDGTPGGLDYAELCVTCDSRVDELRLLGNGVVPATAAKAFKTLIQAFIQ